MRNLRRKGAKAADAVSVDLTTPVGTVVYNKLNFPYLGRDGRGSFSCGLTLTDDEADAFEHEAHRVATMARPDCNGLIRLPVYGLSDRPGRFVFARTSFRPAIVDLDDRAVEGIEAGLRARFIGSLRPWSVEDRAGVTYYLRRVIVDGWIDLPDEAV